MDFACRYDSPLGQLTMKSDGESLVGLWFGGQQSGAEVPAAAHGEKALPVFSETAHWLDLYFNGERPDFTPPLSLRGSDFRREVWKLLFAIPYGKTTTYGKIAAQIADARGVARISAQAVGGAVGHNPVAIIVPCHRVVGKNGTLTGYAGGLEKKEFLLALESRNPHSFS